MSIGDKMIHIKSQRAQKLLKESKFFKTSPSSQMRSYPSGEIIVAVEMDCEENIVKNLSFYGELLDWQRVLLESWAFIMIGKNISFCDQITLRECEAFLRDRNSEQALEGIEPETEATFKRLFTWVKQLSHKNEAEAYSFSSQKGPFRNLKLADKVRELKGFLNSPEVASLYQGHLLPVLLEVEDLTVYLEVSYQTEEERALFEELHTMGVEVFQEESLNFIPDAL